MRISGLDGKSFLLTKFDNFECRSSIKSRESLSVRIHPMRKFFLLCLVAMVLAPSLSAAHNPARPHVRSRLIFSMGMGTGLYPGYWYGPPYYYGPPWLGAPVYSSPSIIIQQSPPVYIEKPQAPEAGYWYYCSSSKSYYPYVSDCPEPWQRVSPVPTPPAGVTP